MTRLLMKRHLAFVAAGICLAWSSTSYGQFFGTRVDATSCAAAIAGNVTASNVSVVCGIPPEVLDALVKSRTETLDQLIKSHSKTISLLEENLDLNKRQIQAALVILGENDVPPERLASKLVDIADRFKVLQAVASAQPGDDPEIAALRNDAQTAIEAGELAKADALLAVVETKERRALDRLAVNAANTLGQRGEIALARLRYGEAARHFASAAGVFSPGSINEDRRIRFLEREASALLLQGNLGDNDALLAAIERYKLLLELMPGDLKTQSNLGFALLRLGERESGTAKLEEAVAVFRKALTQLTRERMPLGWAALQADVGFALLRLGEREGGTAKLEEAVAAFREALKERTHERVPLDWAETQNVLGFALLRLGNARTIQRSSKRPSSLFARR
jgi:tetratricopeptide (TPR) repeat protein